MDAIDGIEGVPCVSTWRLSQTTMLFLISIFDASIQQNIYFENLLRLNHHSCPQTVKNLSSGPPAQNYPHNPPTQIIRIGTRIGI